MFRLGSLWLGAVLLVVSCDQSASRVSTLWTNVPEIASAVEAFNAAQRDWQVLVEYREDPATAVTASGRKPDLVIARHLASSEVKDSLASLEFLFDGGQLAKSSFFQRSLEAGVQGDRLKLVPVSFDLPILIYSRVLLPSLPGFSIALADLQTQNEAFEAGSNPNQRRMAFSPRWNAFGPTFLYWTGAAFHEGFQGALAWDGSALASGVTRLQAWPSPGSTLSADFQHKYLQTDITPVLTSGRIQFFPTTLSAFLTRPWRERRDLDFRFLDQNGRVLASDTTVWAGIPASSTTRGASERFLSWLFKSENQRALLLRSQAEDDRTFGLAQGIPALVAANATISELYPELAGRLPSQEQVSFWPTLPSDWPLLKTSVVKPWLELPAAKEANLREGIERQRDQATQR